MPARIARLMVANRTQFEPANAAQWEIAVANVRRDLNRHGMTPEVAAAGLALAGAAMARTLQKRPYPTQYRAAWLILQNRFVEMATGEGKTLAAALAAAVAAMGGVPVHVLTANEYLVQRDAALLAPFYALLGLTVGTVRSGMPAVERQAAYRCNVTYGTAKEVAFDYLRDRLTLKGERDPLVLRARALSEASEPLLAGLCMAIIDEADSILLDEACVPLILAAPAESAVDAAFRHAYDVAGELWRNRDYQLATATRSARLTEAGTRRVAERGMPPSLPPRRATELVEVALAARRCYRRDRDYAVTAAGIEIIDEVTGRLAAQRKWSNGLHQMIELKEGMPMSALTATAGSMTYQRFFPRYVRLGGMSGTLTEARRELRRFFGATVARVPLAKPSGRRWLGTRMFANAEQKWCAVVERVRALAAAGRPVLIGTESVEVSTALAERLTRAGVTHQVLTALQDADEAHRIALAGNRGMVTVATNIAGRGTDIQLGAGVAALGGLHVIACLRNRARRIDRQLIGRAARHGDPGSAEAVLALDDRLLTEFWPAWCLRFVAALAPARRVPALLAHPLAAIPQRAREWQDYCTRRELRLADARARHLYAFVGGTE
jgi:preprotein translocase subunit SecA